MARLTPAYPIAAALGFVALILDSKTALQGGSEGLILVLKTIIPSLFPFLFLSAVISTSIPYSKDDHQNLLGKLFRIPAGAQIVLISAFLGGYPAGAQAVSTAYKNGTIQKETAEKMLSFCNNAGPAFLFGMISRFFQDGKSVWLLWIFHILGALAAAQMYPCERECVNIKIQHNRVSITEILKHTLSIISILSGWIILFRILIAYADRWFLWMIPEEVRTVLIGLLELSNGIMELDQIANESLRFFVCSILISLGGLCITLQTFSVTEGLSKKWYFRGKVVQCTVSLLCCLAYIVHCLFIIPVIIPFLAYIPKIRSGNLQRVGI